VKPVDGSIVAIEVFPDVQVPPDVASAKVEVKA